MEAVAQHAHLRLTHEMDIALLPYMYLVQSAKSPGPVLSFSKEFEVKDARAFAKHVDAVGSIVLHEWAGDIVV